MCYIFYQFNTVFSKWVNLLFDELINVVEVKNGQGLWENPRQDEITKIGKNLGFDWGGDWKSFKDAPHFQKAFGLKWQQMKSKIDSGDFERENEIKYINL